MVITTKYEYGDRVWSVARHCYTKDVPCESCHGEGGADIPGTKVRVECQDCGGTGEKTGEWFSFDVWFAEVRRVSVTVKKEWTNKPPETKVVYSLVGIWDDGQVRGSDFDADESRVFDNPDDAIAWANEQAARHEDAKVCGSIVRAREAARKIV